MKTIRQEIIRLLSGATPLRLSDLSQLTEIRIKEVSDHLTHIARTLKARKQKLLITPSECLACGFVFDSRSRFSEPSRCPECKAQRIREAEYRLETKAGALTARDRDLTAS